MQVIAGEKGLKDWERWRWVMTCKLTEFQPLEDLIAYRQFLVGWRKDNQKSGAREPLILSPRLDREMIARLTARFMTFVERVPSFFARGGMETVIGSLQDAHILYAANDDDLFREQHGSNGGAS